MQQYAVFGNPVAHSKSPDIHYLFALQTLQQVEYHRQCVELDGFRDAVTTFFANGGCGLNVTVPFKLEAYEMASQLTSRAAQAGAVNTLWRDNGMLHGDNTDGVGLCRDINANLGWKIEGASILMLGAGGAAHGVIGPMLAGKPQQIIIVNRTVEKAQVLIDQFRSNAEAECCDITALTYDQLQQQSIKIDILVNATSASLQGESLPIPSALVSGVKCYDMMYASNPTPFLRWAAVSGALSVADGLGMLVEQAAESFAIWRGVKPETPNVIEQIRRSL